MHLHYDHSARITIVIIIIVVIDIIIVIIIVIILKIITSHYHSTIACFVRDQRYRAMDIRPLQRSLSRL